MNHTVVVESVATPPLWTDQLIAWSTLGYVILTLLLFVVMFYQLLKLREQNRIFQKPVLIFGLVSDVDSIGKESAYEADPKNFCFFVKNDSTNLAENITIEPELRVKNKCLNLGKSAPAQYKLDYLNPHEIAVYPFGHTITQVLQKEGLLEEVEGYGKANKWGNWEYLKKVPKGKKPNCSWMKPKDNFSLTVKLKLTHKSAGELETFHDEVSIEYNVGDMNTKHKPVMNVSKYHTRENWTIYPYVK